MKKQSRWWDLLGWVALILFVAIYAVELLPHHGRPVTLAWIEDHFGKAGLIALNILMCGAFLLLLPYRKPTKHVWKTRGAFLAFLIALMTEMFGFPLLIFMLAPFFEVSSIARNYIHAVGHWVASVGTAVSILGLILVAIGWRSIHQSDGLVTDGIYRFVRHPQYTGLMLFTLGWLVHWPSWFTLGLWPVLIIAYVWLARFEEKMAIEEFGDAYLTYAAKTKRFVPGLF
ncbi:MAG: isoprenylcysteine carboxylmethyltransferase family protein [Acidobacteria bacterium]|nr:isoprenylcysteine carboxylmethyltransferase family protein [Acidobacteriota bacterium]